MSELDPKTEQFSSTFPFQSQRSDENEVFNLEIVLHFNESDEKELVKGVEAKYLENGDVSFASIIHSLKAMGYPLDTTILSYYSSSEELFVYIGNDPVPSTSFIPKEDISKLGGENRLRIEVQQGAKSDILASIALNNKQEEEKKGEGRRKKERKIGYIIEKVSLWRKLYNGIQDGDGNTLRCSLEEAAEKVRISKKSLDDYLLQLRFGRRFGFNFNEHKDDKVGILRAFVKKHKDQLKDNSKVKKEEIVDDIHRYTKGSLQCSNDYKPSFELTYSQKYQ